jgi:hypothetical protein
MPDGLCKDRRMPHATRVGLSLFLGLSFGVMGACAKVQSNVHPNADQKADLNQGAPMPYLSELQKLRDSAYLKAREKALDEHRDTIRMAFPSEDIPDLRAAYRLILEWPKKANEYHAILAGDYRSFWPQAIAVKVPPIGKIAEALEKFGPEFTPLAEEYLFQFSLSALPVSYSAIAKVFLKFNPDKGRKVYAKGWRQALNERPESAWLFLDGLAALETVDIIPELRAHYHASKEPEERDYYRMALAELQDEETDKHVQGELQREDLPPREREAYFAAYLWKRGGSNAFTLAEAYRQFKGKAQREWIVQKLTLYNDSEAKVWQSIAEGEHDAKQKEAILKKIAAFTKRKAEAERAVK